MTVSEVWHNAWSLEGERICVRGQADFEYIPYDPQLVGGCPVVEDKSDLLHIVGKPYLLDKDSLDPKHRLLISESSVRCGGTVCEVVCEPFNPRGYFELVGALVVDTQEGEMVLTLKDIDLQVSRQMAQEGWGPIPTGKFYEFFQ